MAKKSIGFVELIWTCPRCTTKNPGPNKFCTACGAPQPENVAFEQAPDAKLITDAEKIARAKAGPDIHCPYCNARNPAGSKFCGACGGDQSGAKARASGGVVGAFSQTAAPAAPTAAPVTAFSETGVSITRDGVNLSMRLMQLFPTYHGLVTPCPMTMTLSSASISWWSASFKAST